MTTHEVNAIREEVRERLCPSCEDHEKFVFGCPELDRPASLTRDDHRPHCSGFVPWFNGVNVFIGGLNRQEAEAAATAMLLTHVGYWPEKVRPLIEHLQSRMSGKFWDEVHGEIVNAHLLGGHVAMNIHTASNVVTFHGRRGGFA